VISQSFPFLLVVNVFLELVAAYIVIRWKRLEPQLYILLCCIAVNFLTYPIAYHVREQLLAPITIIEVAVFFVEAAAYRLSLGCRPRSAITLAFFTNLVTIGCGFWLGI